MKKLILIIIFNLISISYAYSLIEVDITRGNLDPLPIAVSPLHVDIKSTSVEGIKVKNLGEDISRIIENNFKSTGKEPQVKNISEVEKMLEDFDKYMDASWE